MPSRRLIIIASLGLALLTACTTEDAMRTIYNTGKGYCRQNPTKCDSGDERRLSLGVPGEGGAARQVAFVAPR